MLTDLGNGLQVTGAVAPWWVGLAILLLSTAGAIARRTSRRSNVPQGERLGRLERMASEERTRRRQLEAVLAELGVPLPFWPPDGPNQPRARVMPAPRPPVSGFPTADEDLDDELTDYTAERRIPVPPLPDSSAFARHRR
jgi:hypothetical protein